jgi:hypothetical protein
LIFGVNDDLAFFENEIFEFTFREEGTHRVQFLAERESITVISRLLENEVGVIYLSPI